MHSRRGIVLTVLIALLLSTPGIWSGEPSNATASQPEPAAHRVLVRMVSNSPEIVLASIDGPTATSIDRIKGLGSSYCLEFGSQDDAQRALDALSEHQDVVWVELDRLATYAFVPNDPLGQDQIWIDSIDLRGAWNITFGSSSIVVAVVDSGVSRTHPDLVGKVLPGYDFLNDHENPVDEVGHGTAVAGIIAARGNDGVGIAGIAMEATILPVKVGSIEGSPISAIVAGIIWSVDQGADVINLSLSTDAPSNALHDAVRYAWERGVPVVVAAGNEPNAITWPGAYPETFSVGASTTWGALTGFTTRANRVDVVAPGAGILTTWTDSGNGDGWASVTGTSFAAPMVSGLLALLLSLDPDLDVEEMRALVTNSAIPVGGIDPVPGAGSGQIDAGATLTSFLSRSFEETWSPADSPVASGVVDRTWLWGPESIATGFESYDEAASGERLIRYFDKARMEINDPLALTADTWFVTNGLLALELISGRMQVGDQRFVTRDPARIAVAGDMHDSGSPTYAMFRTRLNSPPATSGAVLTLRMDSAGRVAAIPRFAEYEVYAAWYVPETNHQIASVFWEHLNSSGPIYVGDELVIGMIFEPTFFATGLPITEAYWIEVRVAGVMTDVLVQCFERRCLTYTPSNPQGWQVEMGNVGRHYFDWRYIDTNPSPPVPPRVRFWSLVRGF